MKSTLLILLLLMVALTCNLFAQTNNSILALEGYRFAHNDTLTSSYSGFVHVNWSQAGIGITVKRVLFMWNRTILPIPKNYKADRNMDYVTTQDPIPAYEINYKYDTIMAGYIIRLTRNLYPYAGTGTTIRTDVIEVTDPDDDPDVYTVDGKTATFATGIVGAFYKVKPNLVIEGCLQINPLLPFMGVGFTF